MTEAAALLETMRYAPNPHKWMEIRIDGHTRSKGW